jgi:hypothetical protein
MTGQSGGPAHHDLTRDAHRARDPDQRAIDRADRRKLRQSPHCRGNGASFILHETNGQYQWIEYYTNLPLTEAFIDLLVSGGKGETYAQ